MKRLKFSILFIFFCCHFFANGSNASAIFQETPPADSNQQIFLQYFHAHFDDIHDVIMRYHHIDPGMKGLMHFKFLFTDSIVRDVSCVKNTTSYEQLAADIIMVTKQWVIPGIIGDFELILPLRTKIVGSDDPDYSEKAILTASVLNEKGQPIGKVPYVLTRLGSKKPLVQYRTNKEGILVETLIDPGKYKLSFSLESYQKLEKVLTLEKGKHCALEIRLKQE